MHRQHLPCTTRLFDLQRPRKFMRDDDDLDAPHTSAKAGGKKGTTHERPPMDPEEAKRRAQALIESTLAQATAQAREEAAAAAAAPPPAPAPEPAPAAAMASTAAGTAAAGGMSGVVGMGSAPPPMVVKKPVKHKAVVVPEAALPEALLHAQDTFELPQYITSQAGVGAGSAGSAPTAAPVVRVTKEQAAAAAAEAAARKERRKQQACVVML